MGRMKMDDELKKTWRIGFKWACSKGYQDLAEDFAQIYAMQSLKRKGPGQKSPRYPFIDYLRSQYARPNMKTKDGLRLRPSRNTHISLDGLKLAMKPHQHQEAGCDAFKLLIDTCVSPIERACIVLRFIWGFEDVEIADCFGRSGAWVTLLFDKIFGRLSDEDAEKLTEETDIL